MAPKPTNGRPLALRNRLAEIRKSEDIPGLEKQLADCLSVTIENVITAGAIACRLKELGRDLDQYKIHLLPVFEKIGQGQILPELFVECLERPALFRRAASLPLSDQQKFVDRKPVTLWELGGTHRKVPPEALTRQDLAQVFAPDGHLRTDSEQISYLRDTERTRSHKEKIAADVLLHKKRKGVEIAGKFYPRSEILHWLQLLD